MPFVMVMPAREGGEMVYFVILDASNFCIGFHYLQNSVS